MCRSTIHPTSNTGLIKLILSNSKTNHTTAKSYDLSCASPMRNTDCHRETNDGA